jgi:HPt (histidine-containing phosphotransfer) domain-containing protein
LRQFAAKQGDAAAQISTAVESGDLKLAERIAHTVKGVAGNLGITEVQSAAQKLEKALRDGEGTVSSLLTEFAGVMSTQVQAIEKALRDSPSVREEMVRTYLSVPDRNQPLEMVSLDMFPLPSFATQHGTCANAS